MPAPGDQHTSLANPFAEPQARISEYTAQEIATLQSRLEKQLGPEYLSSRKGPSGQKVHYITAEKCIALANEVFGFNGWSSSIQNFTMDFFDENPQTLRISLGLSVVVRVTLRDGTYHEDVGYGHIENCKGKAAAFEKAKKEGTTDALKRALRHFGNVLGNCIYDKTYLEKVTRMKVAPTKFDENYLHRHPDYSAKTGPAMGEASKEEKSVAGQQHVTIPPARPPPQLPTTNSFEDFLGELDEADFNISDEGHPDEVMLPNSVETGSNQSNMSNKSHNQAGNGGNNTMHPPARQLSRTGSAGNNPRQPPQTPAQQPLRPNTNNFPGTGAQAQNHGPVAGPRPPQQLNQTRPLAPQQNNSNSTNHHNPQTHMTPPQTIANNNHNVTGGAPAGGFFSARAMKGVPEESIVKGTFAPKPGHAFNPRLESPSIPRTPGIDHSASKPLTRKGQHVPGRKGEDGEGDGPIAGAAAAGLNRLPAGVAGGQQGGGGAASRPVVAGGGPRPLGNVVNPQLDQARRIGAPGSSSPLGNRGQFRPLTVKRPAGGADGPVGAGATAAAAAAAGRTPLGDVSSNGVIGGPNGNGAAESGKRDLKRQRTS